MKSPMPFSWKAVFLAPLLVPFLTGAFFGVTAGGKPLWSFLFFFVLCSILSYGATLFLLLPGFFVSSCFTRLCAWKAGLLGLVLGLFVYFPVSFEMYASSGVDSGPPSGTFLHYLQVNFLEDSWVFLASGMVTALLYWLLARERHKELP